MITTILDTFQGISAYPIPQRTLSAVALRRGISLIEPANYENMASTEYKLCKADLLVWLSQAPNISQGGQSFSFTDEQRKQYRQQANALYEECGEEDSSTRVIYGYKGSRL